MVLQCARLDIRQGQESEFERAFDEARTIIARQPGLRWVRLERCLENTSRHLFLAEWERMEDHTEVFPASADYQRWSTLLHHFYDPTPTVEHFEPVPLAQS